MSRKIESHRGVVPENVLVYFFGKKLIHQGLHGSICLFFIQTQRQVRLHYEYARRVSLYLHMRWTIRGDRLFNKEDTPFSSTATHKMLWALIHKIPAQMGKTNKIQGARFGILQI